MKLINKKNKKYVQIFQLFTEEKWKESNKNFNKNIASVFSGKKNHKNARKVQSGILFDDNPQNSQAIPPTKNEKPANK